MLARDFPGIGLSCGWDDQALEFFAWGARSWVCAASNFLPQEHIALYEACVVEKNFDKGRRIMSAMMPLMDFLEDAGKFVQSIKYGCELNGLHSGGLRAPLQGLDDAQKQFELMHKNNANDLTPLMALALIKIQQKNYPEAKTFLTQYAQQADKTQGADSGQAYIYLAQLALEQKDEAGAAGYLDKIPPTSQQYIPAQITRAQLLEKQGKPDEARKLLANIHAMDPRDQALIARTDAAILFDAKRYQEAEARLQQATADFPDDPDLTYDYAMAAEKTGHYEVMEAQLRKLMRTQPDNAQAYNALGYSLADRNQRLQEADKLVEKASALAPNDAFILDSVGWVKYRLGDTSDAIKILRKAYDMQPNAEIGAHLGEVLWKSGDQEQAKAAWREARKLEPDNDTLVKTLKRFQVNDL